MRLGLFGAVAPGVAASNPASWTELDETAPGECDSHQDFYANDVFTGVAALGSPEVRLGCGELDPSTRPHARFQP